MDCGLAVGLLESCGFGALELYDLGFRRKLSCLLILVMRYESLGVLGSLV